MPSVIFPLKSRTVIRGCAEHKAAGLECATDYVADHVPVYAPVSGKVEWFDGIQGGTWIRIIDAEGRRWEFAHLSERLVAHGSQVIAGQRIGTTGNTGQLTTGPHLHIQIIKNGQRIDPESLLANAPFPMPHNPDSPHNNQIVRFGISPLRYALVIRGKKREFSGDSELAQILVLRSYNLLPPIETVDQATWESFPISDGIRF